MVRAASLSRDEIIETSAALARDEGFEVDDLALAQTVDAAMADLNA